MIEYNLINLVDNLKNFQNFEKFSKTFKNCLKNFTPQVLHSNIQHIFKDEELPSSFNNNEFSLMTLNDHELTGGNYVYLMYYILPEEERIIFLSKE